MGPLGHRARVGAVCAALWLAGCASLASDRPSVLAAGEHEVGVGWELGLLAPKLAPDANTPLPSSAATVSYRHGFEGWDLGGRAWGLGIRGLFGVGAAADVRARLTAPDPGEDGFLAAFRGSAGYHQLNYGSLPTHFPHFGMAVSAGWRVEGLVDLYLALRIDDFVLIAEEVETQNIVFYGLAIGSDWQVGEGIWLEPRLVLSGAPVSFNGTLEDQDRQGLPLVQLGLEVRWTP